MGPLNRHYFKLVYETVTRKKKLYSKQSLYVEKEREKVREKERNGGLGVDYSRGIAEEFTTTPYP